jgi:cholesterol transport system auxiliary component
MRRDNVTRACRLPVLFAAALLLMACAALPERAAAPLRYDFGLAPAPVVTGANRPALALRVQASPELEGHAMLYRLAYADAQQLRAYSQARWAMAPAELLEQRLRSGLGRDYALAPGGEGAARVLHVELEEFSQVYATPEQSQGVLRLRVSLLQRTAAGEQLLAQRELLLQQVAARPDAAAGVQALGAATDEAVTELVRWMQMQRNQ